MVRAIMHGCNGHMGRVITGLCAEDEGIEIVAGVDVYTGVENKYPVYPDMASCKEEADVVIDFSNAAAVDGLLEECEKRKLPVILCTTGLSDKQLKKVEAASHNTAVLKSANMSLGINTLLALLSEAAEVFAPAGYDMEIVERHHNQKLDAPSGTAIALADALNGALPERYEYVYDRSTRREKRPKREIGISAVRGGNIVGDHEVIFAGTDEVISFRHTATSKAVFAKGAIEAAKYLAGKPAGMYDMRDVVSR
ncbi:MAG: 4-hydroxy-tetrahydrodipicolinate reductase [Lachnospiraceae bacterium]|nr:4-hydroxy-tetrahydrodipicolinate reductase [Lachnospiraceae bacterium]